MIALLCALSAGLGDMGDFFPVFVGSYHTGQGARRGLAVVHPFRFAFLEET